MDLANPPALSATGIAVRITMSLTSKSCHLGSLGTGTRNLQERGTEYL